MNNKLKPALLGGLIVGVLSAIPFINYCCCIWSIGGGVLAAYLYIKSSQTPVAMGEGAMVGGMAGAVGAVIYLILGLPIAIFSGWRPWSNSYTAAVCTFLSPASC